MKKAVVVENLSKKYTISEREKYLVLSELLVKAAKVPGNLLRGKKFRKKEEFWALKDVNFTVNQGEIIGIIGRNGAGKSTLLKVLSRITEPTHGLIKLNGRVASLLEVGTGFHPELTGRENIYLNGAILGMSKREIDRKFDEIVEFSGIERFLDMPVKRYSSGMQVRLAFSVGAHLEPDILIIDEVLAVGDAEFQKKCLGKMNEVTKDSGRTILFVSHDMGAVQKLCTRTILLEQGQVSMVGNTKDVIKEYMSSGSSVKDISKQDINERPGSKKWIFSKLKLVDVNGENINHVDSGNSFKIVGRIDNKSEIENCIAAVVVYRDDGVKISKNYSKTLSSKKNVNFEVVLKDINLLSGVYYFTFWAGSIDGKEIFDQVEGALKIEVINNESRVSAVNYGEGIISIKSDWKYE